MIAREILLRLENIGHERGQFLPSDHPTWLSPFRQFLVDIEPYVNSSMKTDGHTCEISGIEYIEIPCQSARLNDSLVPLFVVSRNRAKYNIVFYGGVLKPCIVISG